ncbi:hypothetical protein D9756_001212 [Leucocoprinus leucothites]|uniref:Uncharacterized protein n=1 Tax=Leucocoprinus leucothites TaxID=201217 RepID=A0A8H5G4Q7_9AGAR|nr:hypothetical protein D9756_001212 [Leucoagaricus leucothites]
MATDATPTAYPVTVTSNLSQPTATAMSTKNTTEFLIRFPPFPNPSEGVEIIPFTEYKEKGIRIQPGEDGETEVDACGAPTIALASVHSTDWCKTETKRAKFNGNGGPGRRKRKRKAGTGLSAGPTPNDWEEYWEEREASYRLRQGYDPHSSAYDLLCQGAYDFKSLRPWPVASKQSGPVFVWGEFLRFAGIPLTSDPIAATKAEDPKPKQKTDDGSDSDMDGGEEDDDPTGGILDPKNLASMESSMKAQARGEQFLRDPALMLKVFFSSYARDRGIIWTDANLTGAPILIRFFVNFLVDNHILPKREESAIKHESTRRVIELALKELPLTSKLAKVWPDEFHKACKGCWGAKAEVYVFRGFSPVEDVAEGAGDGEAGPTAATDTAAPAHSGWGGPADTVVPTPTNGAWDSGDRNASSEWGNDNEDWGSTMVTVNMDEDGEIEVKSETPLPAADDHSEVGNDGDNWNTFQPPSFIPLLGPTALPLTHTTGIVESSVRRIKSVTPPSTDTAKFPISKGLSADAVEGVLKRTFGVVVFEPWVNWNKGEEPHLSMPKILESSRGVVKTENAVEGGEVASSTPVPAPSALPPFDPHKDDISVLVEPAYIDLFSVGMGCLCTWVQLARVEDFEPQDPKKKKKKNAKTERLWYVEEALRVVPSYYTYLE